MPEPPRPRPESGNISVMTIGFLAVLGLLLVVVINSSAVFLERRVLMNLADTVALSAADAVDEDDFLTHGDPQRLRIDPVLARRQAREQVGADTNVDLWVDGGRVRVRLERSVVFLIRPPGLTSRTVVVAEASAQIHVR